MPFSLSELAGMAAVLRDIFITLHMEKHLPPAYSLSRSTQPIKPHPQVHGHSPSTPLPHPLSLSPAQEWLKLKYLLQDLLCALYQRDCRRPYCPEGHWVASGLTTSTIPPELFIENEGRHIYDLDSILWTQVCYSIHGLLQVFCCDDMIILTNRRGGRRRGHDASTSPCPEIC